MKIRMIASASFFSFIFFLCAGCADHDPSESSGNQISDYGVLSNLDLTHSNQEVEAFFGDSAITETEQGLTWLKYSFDTPEKDALFETLPKMITDYANRASKFESRFEYITGEEYFKPTGMAMNASYGVNLTFSDEESWNKLDCKTVIDSVNDCFGEKYQISDISNAYLSSDSSDSAGTVIRNYPAEKQEMTISLEKNNNEYGFQFGFYIFVSQMMEESGHSSKPDTSDGEIGDNNGDGVIDEKDFEIEWKHYVDEKMKDHEKP